MTAPAALTRANRLLEGSRIAGVVAGFAVASSIDGSEARLRVLQLWLVLSVAGLTAIEGLFFGRGAALMSGYGDPGPYQRQSALNNLALVCVSVWSFLAGWGAQACAAILAVLLCFLVLSGINHALSKSTGPPHTLRRFTRPLMSLALIAACAPFLLAALR